MIHMDLTLSRRNAAVRPQYALWLRFLDRRSIGPVFAPPVQKPLYAVRSDSGGNLPVGDALDPLENDLCAHVMGKRDHVLEQVEFPAVGARLMEYTPVHFYEIRYDQPESLVTVNPGTEVIE